MMTEKTSQAKIVDRLRRVEGQVRGITQMVQDERYCIDILHQLQAVKSALSRAEDEILKNHAAHCVAQAIATGDAEDQRAMVSELVELFARAKR